MSSEPPSPMAADPVDHEHDSPTAPTRSPRRRRTSPATRAPHRPGSHYRRHHGAGDACGPTRRRQDTGLGHGQLTSDATPTLTGTAEPGATVMLKEGDTVLGTVVPTRTAIDDHGFDADGAHTITVTVTDAAGTRARLRRITITVDTAAGAPTGLDSPRRRHWRERQRRRHVSRRLGPSAAAAPTAPP